MIVFRNAIYSDCDLYYLWANDPVTRFNSFNPDEIAYTDHVKWFSNKLKDQNTLMLLFEDHGIPIGQVRFELNREESGATIGISIDKERRNLGYGSAVLDKACDYFFHLYPDYYLDAFIKKVNTNSIKTFINSKFNYYTDGTINNIEIVHYRRKALGSNLNILNDV